MARTPRQTSLCIPKGQDPIHSGGDVGNFLLPVVAEVLVASELDPRQRVMFWTGFFSSLSGAMAADIGFHNASAVLEAVLKSIDRATVAMAPEEVH